MPVRRNKSQDAVLACKSGAQVRKIGTQPQYRKEQGQGEIKSPEGAYCFTAGSAIFYTREITKIIFSEIVAW